MYYLSIVIDNFENNVVFLFSFSFSVVHLTFAFLTFTVPDFPGVTFQVLKSY